MIRTGNVARVVRDTNIANIIEDTEISYYMLYQLNGLPFNDSELDLHDVEVFLRSDAVSNEIGNVAGGYARALTRGDLNYYLTTEEIVEIVQNLEPEVNDLFDHQMTEADNVRFARIIDDIMGFNGLTVEAILDDVGIGNAIPFLVISPYLLLLTGLLCFAIMFAFYCLNKKRIANVYLLSGIPIILTGLIYLTAGLVLRYFPEMLPDSLYRFTRFTGGVVSLVITYGIVVSVVGLLFIMIFAILKQNNIKKRRV